MNTILIGSRNHVRPESIKFLKADNNYTTIYFLDGTKTLVSTTMGTIEGRLPREKFVRINRGTVINREVVSDYFVRPEFDEVRINDNTLIKVSRRNKKVFRRIFLDKRYCIK